MDETSVSLAKLEGDASLLEVAVTVPIEQTSLSTQIH